jgi:outer membrane biosynthesis protein TonB
MRLDHGAWAPSAPRPSKSPSPGPQRGLFTGYVSGPLVLVDVNADGSVRGTRLLESAGRPADTRPLHIAQTSRYQAKIVGCTAVEGTYYFFLPVQVI